MTNEEMQRNMEFIVQQQAQFAGEIHQINESLAAQGQLLSRQNEAIVLVMALVGRIAETQEKHEGRLANLEEKMTMLTERVDTLTERVDAFITFVEKYIASRNGGPKGETIQ